MLLFQGSTSDGSGKLKDKDKVGYKTREDGGFTYVVMRRDNVPSAFW